MTLVHANKASKMQNYMQIYRITYVIYRVEAKVKSKAFKTLLGVPLKYFYFKISFKTFKPYRRTCLQIVIFII